MVMSSRLPWFICLSLVVLFLPSLPIASAKAVGGRTERWFNPCAGSRTILTDPEEEVQKIDLVHAFDALARKSESLRRRVKMTKTQYVEKRFRHESVTQDFAGFRNADMPSTHSATVSSIGHAEITSTVHQAFDDLARVAVFVHQARIGEALAINENHYFEEEFQTIEDHQEVGLYNLLCFLHQVIVSTGQTLSADTYNSIMDIKIQEVDNNYCRHIRDYLVLRDFEKILARLSVHFVSLKDLHSSVHV